MAASIARVASLVSSIKRPISTNCIRLVSTTCVRLEDTDAKKPLISEIFSSDNETADGQAGSGLEKTFRMFDKVERSAQETELPDESFAAMLRKSKLMQIGNPNGRIVIGTVFETVEDDLYIDFGGKFHCVCKKPRSRSE